MQTRCSAGDEDAATAAAAAAAAAAADSQYCYRWYSPHWQYSDAFPALSVPVL